MLRYIYDCRHAPTKAIAFTLYFTPYADDDFQRATRRCLRAASVSRPPAHYLTGRMLVYADISVSLHSPRQNGRTQLTTRHRDADYRGADDMATFAPTKIQPTRAGLYTTHYLKNLFKAGHSRAHMKPKKMPMLAR